MDYSYRNYGCFLEPVESCLDDIMEHCRYKKKDRISIDTANFLLKEAQEFRTQAMHWLSLGAIPEALEHSADYVKRLRFVRDKCEMLDPDKEIIQKMIDEAVDYAIAVHKDKIKREDAFEMYIKALRRIPKQEKNELEMNYRELQTTIKLQ